MGCGPDLSGSGFVGLISERHGPEIDPWEAGMHHLEFSSQIARERQARYFADAGRRRLVRAARSAADRETVTGRIDGDRP